MNILVNGTMKKQLRLDSNYVTIKSAFKNGRLIIMNNIDIANGIVFQKMEISKESFEDRLICQKKIYLLQSLGTDLGYTYNWYVRGPYSPSLTNYVYNNLEVLSSNDFSGYSLSSSAENNIDMVNSLLEDKRADFGIASWYDEGDNALFGALIKQKPQFNKEQCAYAFDTLRKKGFIQLGV